MIILIILRVLKTTFHASNEILITQKFDFKSYIIDVINHTPSFKKVVDLMN